MGRVRAAFAVMVLGLSAVGCGAAPVPVGSGCTPGGTQLPDGRWFVMVDRVVGGSVRVDLACFYSGADAAAAESSVQDPWGPYSVWAPPGYFVHNVNDTRRDVPVASGAKITMRNMSGDPAPAAVSLATFGQALGPAAVYYPAWITTKGGKITSLMTTWFSTPEPKPLAAGCNSVSATALPTGHWYVNVTAITTTTVSMDLLCFYDGASANGIALRLNRNGQEELSVPNDYFIVNSNPAIRKMSMTSSTGLYGLSEATTVKMSAAQLWSSNYAQPFLALVTVSGGKVQEVRQRFVP